jgi:hypothetical protein
MSKRLLGPTFLLLSLALLFLAAEGLLRLLSRNWLRVLDVEMWRYARSVKKASSYKDVVEEHQPNASAFLTGGRIRTDVRRFRLPALNLRLSGAWRTSTPVAGDRSAPSMESRQQPSAQLARPH